MHPIKVIKKFGDKKNSNAKQLSNIDWRPNVGKTVCAPFLRTCILLIRTVLSGKFWFIFNFIDD